MTPRLLTTQEAAERLGLTPGSLQKLRWQDDGLPIFQHGLDVHYRLEDLETFEQRELRKLLKQVLQHERPLPLIANLERQNFRCYMPMLYVEKVRRGKSVVVAEPMFPSYVFVQLDTSGQGQSWSPIRSTLGVRELVKFGGRAPKVEADLIHALHEREQLQQFNPQALFAAGDTVVITDGPFVGIEAIYQTTDAERRSMILLSMLSKPVPMRIDSAKLRKCG
jgi:transcription elongation factor/antiterminator RfaH